MRGSNELFSLVRSKFMLGLGKMVIPSGIPRAGPEGHRSYVFLGHCTGLSHVRRGAHI